MEKRNIKVIVSLVAVLLVSAFFLTSCSAFSLSNFFDNSISDDDSNSVATDTEKGSKEYQKWMEWLKEFEKWMDSYISIMQKYQQNPSSPFIMVEYLNATAEMIEWTAKAAEIESDDEMTAAEAMKILAEYERILAKQYSALESIS